MSVFEEIYTTGKKFYTAGGSDGSDKSHLCSVCNPEFLNVCGNIYFGDFTVGC